MTVYQANGTAHRVPVTLAVSLARLKSGVHTLKIAISYKETRHVRGHRTTPTLTKTLRVKFKVC